MKRLLGLGLLLWGLLWVGRAGAQAEAPGVTAAISAIDANNFPEIHAYLAVANAAGDHLAGLPAEAFSVLENDTAISTVALLEAEIGAQVVIVIDPGLSFKTRNAAGVSRWDAVREAVADFAASELREVDDLTLVTPEGALIAHVNAGQPVVDALNRYTPTFEGAADPSALVSIGLNFASDPTPRPGMRRILLVAANSLPADAPATDLVERAVALRIPIHTLYVGPVGSSDTFGAQTLRQLSQQSGGLDLLLEDASAFEQFFSLIAQQRSQYRLAYRSAINTTGQHTLTVGLTLPTGEAVAVAPAGFQLRVEPPMLEAPAVPAVLDPALAGPWLAVPVAVTFPDGQPREVTRVALWVDGEEVAAQAGLAASLDWPLAVAAEAITHTVQLRLVDELGLATESEAVQVRVLPAPVAALKASPAQETAAAVGNGLVVAGGVVAVVAVVGGGVGAWVLVRRRRQAAAAHMLGGETIPGRPIAADPRLVAARRRNGTAPLKAPPATDTRPMPPVKSARQPRPVARPVGLGRAKTKGKAYLEVVEPGGGGAARENIELYGQTIKLGRDPGLATVLFSDRSVSRLHARIEETREGVFCLFDEGSTSGTWVNFSQISLTTGHALQPGDLINLGRVQLRFRRAEVVEAAPAGRPAAPGQPEAPRPDGRH